MILMHLMTGGDSMKTTDHRGQGGTKTDFVGTDQVPVICTGAELYTSQVVD